MEFLDGVDLADLLATPEAWTIEQQLEIAIEITDALAAAHANGIVHRDVKPGNIVLVSEGDQRRPILLDFGIVRRPDSDITLTQTQPGTLRGTL